jgi:hypothetical protein
MSEQSCPDRAFAPPGPFGPGGTDTWETDRWTKDPEVAEQEIRNFMAKNPTGGISTNLWKSDLPVPRTCSYCGGIHPDDAVTLLEGGWEVEATTKSYKRYLQPPGYHKQHLDVMQSLQSGSLPEFWHPRPPVKLYVSHFSPEQIDKFNATVKDA